MSKRDFRVPQSGGRLSFLISGENLVDAVEQDFDKLASAAHIGNAAGYALDQVWMEWNETENIVKLHIVSHGSDGLVGYDPTQDPPKESVIRIEAERDDCPERHDFDLDDDATPRFDPFEEKEGAAPDAVFGTALGMMDWVAEHRCRIKQVRMHTFVSANMSSSYPHKMLLLVLARLNQLHPNKDKDTENCMVRISNLVEKFCTFDDNRLNGAYLIFYYKTMSYFRRRGKVTNLSKLRKKADLTQQQLAEQVGISVRQLARYEDVNESGLSNAKHSIIKALADAVGATPEDLVDGSVVLVKP